MNEKEIRVKSLEFAFQYLEYYDKCQGHSTAYKTEYGIIGMAQKFEWYINEGK